jgi:ABC-2 type transport system permease protein
MRHGWPIAAKDLCEFRRDGRLQAISLCVLLLLVAAVAGGAVRASRAAAERADAARAERDRWLDQGDVNPHAAAHYGTFVFAPIEPLAMIDPGVSPHVGAAVFLEAHRQQLARYRPLENATSFRRLGELSVASCLQVFVPLFLVLLAVVAVTRERERGTWRLLIATGGRPRSLIAGKALGIALILLAVVGPAAAAASAALIVSSGASLDSDSALRGLLLLGAYLVYFAIWLPLALAISVSARSTRQALAAGVALWLVTTVVAPPALLAIASFRTPAPSAAAFTVAIDTEREQRPSWDDRVAAATDRFLRGEALPAASNPEVVALIDTEAADTELYGRHLEALANIFDSQAATYRLLSILSPSVAMQVISMSLAATDYDHHRHFLAATSAYRTELLAALNEELAAFDSWRTFNATGNRDLWARVPEFTYDTPPAQWAVRRLAGAAAGMGGWLLAAVGLLWRNVKVHGARP